ncbi:GGDEF domain-containing protein [Pseudogracilibacillus sp. SE30717A]|uniref:sensor domain-containing diguanylate cyclase n=1 Tax=Pseudogracilibacillus sp. SE30717A TaxID=3098293 RepID=UPI00300DCCF1
MGEQISNNLKASLFDLTYIIENFKRKQIMDMLCLRIRKTLEASRVVFYMYNKWQLEQQMTYYSCTYPITGTENFSLPTFIKYYKEKQPISMLNTSCPVLIEQKGCSNFLLKFKCQENCYGFIVISFDKEKVLTMKDLEQSRIVIEQFLCILYTNRHHKTLQDRNHLMFQLSTRLHSVHRTEEVLEKIYDTIQILYPSFTYNLLLSQEFDYCDVPIKLIEYSKETSLSPGLISFMNNKLQIDQKPELNETNIYSPLSGKQGVYGVLHVTIPLMIQLLDEEIEFIQNFTNMAGRAIERTTLYQSSNQLVSNLQTINNASQELNTNLELHDITKIVQKHILNSTFAEENAVVLFHEESSSGYEILKGSTNYFTSIEGHEFAQFVKKKLLANPRPCLTGDFHSNNIQIPFKSLMMIPMSSSENVYGAIIIAHRSAYYFNFEKYKFVQSIVQHASLAFYNSILKEKLKQIAITDYLTNLYSRNHLDKIIKQQLKAGDYGAFILFDVDDFKQINDTYGHYIGDKVLIQVANIIKSEMNSGEIAARWGGEEFAIYLPHYELKLATEKANTIRKKVLNKTKPQVSLSCGVSIWTNQQEESVEDLFIRADEALYEAKTSGKNKVVKKVYIPAN